MTLRNPLAEIVESAILSAFEPNPVQFRQEHEYEVARVQAALRRASDGKLVRFRWPVNRSSFLVGALDYTEMRDEHLIVAYGFRHGSTTKVESLHHVIGGPHSVAIPASVAHALWDHYGEEETNEVILFHNHPQTLISQLLDWPLPSIADRLTLEARALQPAQLWRRLLGQGRVLFFLQEAGLVREFTLPSVLALLARTSRTG
jgi:hypothetical protein